MLRGDGSFVWFLRPGEYTIVAMEYEHILHGRSETTTGRIGGSFEVPQEPAAVYIGTLSILQDANRFLVAVRDDFADASTAANFPQGAGKESMARRLLVVERVPDGQKQIGICDGSWGLSCTKDNYGVIPISPPSEKENFESVSSLEPVFSWQPSPVAGVTYDFVIHRALPYKQKGFESSYVHGPIIEWATELTEPRYTLKKPLDPDSKYFWSVRLRKGDVVSDWSSTSFFSFYFLVFAYATETGRGVPFNFRTP